MDWRRHPSADSSDPNGVADLLARACAASGVLPVESPVSGTRFVTSTREMIRVSRTIETGALTEPGSPLYVGFQASARALPQSDLYESIEATGTQVVAFATDDGSHLGWGSWTAVEEDPLSLCAQWFLVRNHADHHSALVAFEVSDARAPRRAWEGFTSDDPRLVALLASHLEAVRTSATVT